MKVRITVKLVYAVAKRSSNQLNGPPSCPLKTCNFEAYETCRSLLAQFSSIEVLDETLMSVQTEDASNSPCKDATEEYESPAN